MTILVSNPTAFNANQYSANRDLKRSTQSYKVSFTQNPDARKNIDRIQGYLRALPKISRLKFLNGFWITIVGWLKNILRMK